MKNIVQQYENNTKFHEKHCMSLYNSIRCQKNHSLTFKNKNIEQTIELM